MCEHTPRCPSAGSSDALSARIIHEHHDQGWSLLCNGVVAFDDLGAVLPDGRCISAAGQAHTAPHRHAA